MALVQLGISRCASQLGWICSARPASLFLCGKNKDKEKSLRPRSSGWSHRKVTFLPGVVHRGGKPAPWEFVPRVACGSLAVSRWGAVGGMQGLPRALLPRPHRGTLQPGPVLTGSAPTCTRRPDAGGRDGEEAASRLVGRLAGPCQLTGSTAWPVCARGAGLQGPPLHHPSSVGTRAVLPRAGAAPASLSEWGQRGVPRPVELGGRKVNCGRLSISR